MSPRVRLAMTVNGRARRVSVPPMKRLLDVLREDCGLTGSKEGCGEGECGACTVLLNGAPVNSCLVPAVHAEGAKVVTVEGLARGERLSALQRAFVERGGSQCGMCTPGMLVASLALLAEHRGRVPTDAQVRDGLSGTLCRCTGYQKIVDAVQAAAAESAAPRRPARARRPSRAPGRTASRRAGTAATRRRAARTARKRAR
ncbi:MAG TPA: (2Fe-2S)-binding protein [Candidatus Acidoferrales bacterium]|nr:(2Fe-2S)-binding protein [Candidatus Acidoferrales bacterium]